MWNPASSHLKASLLSARAAHRSRHSGVSAFPEHPEAASLQSISRWESTGRGSQGHVPSSLNGPSSPAPARVTEQSPSHCCILFPWMASAPSCFHFRVTCLLILSDQNPVTWKSPSVRGTGVSIGGRHTLVTLHISVGQAERWAEPEVGDSCPPFLCNRKTRYFQGVPSGA